MKNEIKNIIVIGGKSYMKVNVVMLPTNKKAQRGQLAILDNRLITIMSEFQIFAKPQHLYITSDEEIKEGDWCYNSKRKSIELGKYMIGTNEFIFCKKIIATTDTSLRRMGDDGIVDIALGLEISYIPESFIKYFIEEYNKGNIITDVLVEYEEMTEYELGCDPAYYPLKERLKLKINSNNTINIKLIKDSWNKEEVNLEKSEFIHLFFSHHTELSNKGITSEYIRTWIEENL